MLNLTDFFRKKMTQSDQQLPLTLVPSLPAASFHELQTLAERLVGVSQGFQIDVVDGQFVPHTSWPFTESDLVGEWSKIRALPAEFAYELDCMIMQPEKYLVVFATLPLSKLIVHVGSTEAYEEIFTFTELQGWGLCVAFTNDVSLESVYPLIDRGASVQIMGIAKVGSQGQPFDERTLDTARTLRTRYPALSIAVDGSVNTETIPKLIAAGVNHFAPGSAISQAADPAAAYQQLSTLLKR
jgi:ribulose-phosphate 3-epimerase